MKDLPLDFKYGPNARYASLDKRSVKEMLATLAAEPESFVLKNNGIMFVAKLLQSEGNTVDLECYEAENDDELPGHGILNGGHTYLALKEALSYPKKYPDAAEKVTVMLTVGLGIPDEEIWKISRARNLSEKVPLHALRELAGDWKDLKLYLPVQSRSIVAFKPDEPEAENAEFDV